MKFAVFAILAQANPTSDSNDTMRNATIAMIITGGRYLVRKG